MSGKVRAISTRTSGVRTIVPAIDAAGWCRTIRLYALAIVTSPRIYEFVDDGPGDAFGVVRVGGRYCLIDVGKRLGPPLTPRGALGSWTKPRTNIVDRG